MHSPELPTRSRLQVSKDATGEWRLADRPDVLINVWDDPEPPRDWLAELGLPKDWAMLGVMAQARGLSSRRFRFVLGDEGPARMPLPPVMEWTFSTSGQLLTLSHLGFGIGLVEDLMPGCPEEAPEAVGEFIIGTARLYTSLLADAAWQGMQRDIFGHVCATLWREAAPIPAGWRHGDPLGGGVLVAEVSVVDRPAIVGARILRTWTTEELGR